jgi:hypothetical protein
MLATAIICLAAGTVVMLAWYLFFLRFNRRKAVEVVRRIEAALAGKGQVLGVRWLSASLFQVRLRLRTSVFQRPLLTVQLAPREMPLKWLARCWGERQDVLTFESDLDFPPGFELVVQNHRWVGRTSQKYSADPKQWRIQRTAPAIITSRRDWQPELTMMVNALLSSRERPFLTLCFRRSSPQFVATVPLQSISRGAADSPNVFDALRELATGASRSRL